MTYNPNTSAVTTTTDVVVDDISNVLLAEFADSAPIREVMFDAPAAEGEGSEEGSEVGRPIASATGVRLHRVVDKDYNTVTEYDSVLEKTPLTFLQEHGAILASTRPGPVYTWQLSAVRKVEEGSDIAMIEATRPATPEEAQALDAMYPGWLDACRKFDLQHSGEVAVMHDRIRVPDTKQVILTVVNGQLHLGQALLYTRDNGDPCIASWPWEPSRQERQAEVLAAALYDEVNVGHYLLTDRAVVHLPNGEPFGYVQLPHFVRTWNLPAEMSPAG